MRTVAVINQKGGVGKTTTAANISFALAASGRRVTVLDLDPQGHLSAHLGHDPDAGPGLDQVLLHGAAPLPLTLDARPNLRLLPSGPDLHHVELASSSAGGGGNRLRNALRGVYEQEDFVVVDCPPASGVLAINALVAVDEILVPVVSDYLGLRGLASLMGTLKRLEQLAQKTIGRLLVVTRFHKRRRISAEAVAKITTYFPGQVLATPIRETTALAESPGFGQTVFEYSPRSNGAADYRDLANDFLCRRTM